MPNKMLIDATHPEETRVVVLRGNRVEEFDFESASRKQLRGNIYLAKVTRVEPSLQAAFVDYGGNRHGFLAFSEIHPDYYQIPVADRQALIDEEERQARAADAEADHRAGRRAQRDRGARRSRDDVMSQPIESQDEAGAMAAGSEVMAAPAGSAEEDVPEAHDEAAAQGEAAHERHDSPAVPAGDTPMDLAQFESSAAAEPIPQSEDAPRVAASDAAETGDTHEDMPAEADHVGDNGNITEVNGHGAGGEEEVVESVGGADAMEEVPERLPRMRRQYKIQEVIKRRQVMLVQVVKEERGTKGAALTTYLSLAGRYSVLMPNTARGGGISRKITSAEDRRRLKEIAQDLEVPEGMGVILRTAGAARTKTEVKRDFEYLLRLWETVRDLTLKSTAPTLVYEEGSLVKRSIRDLYNKDIDEVLVAGDEGYKDAREFMRMLMPSHGKNVKPFRDTLPIFTRFGIESQLDAMFQPVVQLRSGGYIVINQAEALVAIDVNSGRATREHHIEDTALKTNCEAAEEIARQLRLRDLAGLIVIDFIDMDEKRNNRTVERRLKESLKHDRARIQVGHISHFGLLEMSRQRIRSSVLESSTEKCPHCGGTGHIRSVSSVSLQLLRGLEEMLLKGATHNIIVRTRTEIALYLLNQKRAHLRVLEERFQLAIIVSADATIGGQVSYAIEKGELVHSVEQAKAIAAQPSNQAPLAPEDEEEDFEQEAEAEAEAETEHEPASNIEVIAEDDSEAASEDGSEPAHADAGHPEGENGVRRRRRRRGGRGSRGEGRGEGRDRSAVAQDPFAAPPPAPDDGDGAPAPVAAVGTDAAATDPEHAAANGESQEEGERRRRRRGRRGGRRNRRDRDGREGEGLPPQSDSPAAFESDPSTSGAEPQPAADLAPDARDDAVARERDEQRPAQPQWQAPPPAPPASEPIPAPLSQDSREPEPAPRRRSTVREPASVSLASEDAPSPPPVEPPQPVISVVSPNEDADKPRRAGWWSKRVLGKG
ncbi:MAG: ribonuclease [Alphaproteobacteria bacterium]|jgi:ribonuclease E|nr:ribonuclease [Alphaproteobacteria bacterium]